jgi:hypothetical protein
MRLLVFAMGFSLMLAASGCKHTPAPRDHAEESFSAVPGMPETAPQKKQAKAHAAARAVPVPQQTLIVTPSSPHSGKVVSVNETARFVVISFPLNHMPALEQQLGVYRNGLKVAEIKITGPQSDEDTVADIRTGDVAVGDEVKTD